MKWIGLIYRYIKKLTEQNVSKKENIQKETSMKVDKIELLLKRIFFNDYYTIGRLSIDGVYFCDTIEDRNRDLNKDGDLNDEGEGKVMHKTCIPFGKYRVVVNRSPTFKRLLPRLLDVPHFSGILIHNGVDETSSSGCIIVGRNTIKGKVTESRHYMNKLTDILLKAQTEGKSITIEIV